MRHGLSAHYSVQSVKVLDAKGNPVVLKAVVTYYATSAKKATIDVENPFPSAVDNAPVLQASGDQPILKVMGGSFLELQAAAVLKQVASRFPYEAAPGLPSLQTEGAEIALELRHLLQERTGMTGACIVSFDLIDLSYAPEIAQAMLVRQQAEALVDARRLIVQVRHIACTPSLVLLPLFSSVLAALSVPPSSPRPPSYCCSRLLDSLTTTFLLFAVFQVQMIQRNCCMLTDPI